MNTKQKIAIIAPLVLLVVMVPIFQGLSRAFGGSVIGWYLGLVVYWLIWCIAFPLWIIGKESIKTLIRPEKLTLKIFLLVLFPVVMASLYKLTLGMGYEKQALWTFLLLLTTPFGNGFFEEILWRGVYMKLFPENILLRIIWPSIGFALWHVAPGSVSSNTNVIGLVVGSGLMGFYLSFLAKKTKTIWWGVVAHTLGGLIMIVM